MGTKHYRRAMGAGVVATLALLEAACGGGSADGGDNPSPPSAQVMLTVGVAGSGEVRSTPAGIQCAAESGGGCSAEFDPSASVTLRATPADGGSFSGWSGDAGQCGTQVNCTITMTQARRVTATFSGLTAYALSVSVVGAGSVSSSPGGVDCGPTCSADFARGTVVSLTATADAGQVFAGWSGACQGTDDCTVTMNAAADVAARFEASGGGSSTGLLAGLRPAITYNRAEACPSKNLSDIYLNLATVNDAGPGATVTSSCYTVAGLASGQSATLTLSTGNYSVNGGAFVAGATGTALRNGDQFRVRMAAPAGADAEAGMEVVFDSPAGRTSMGWTIRTRNSTRAAQTWRVGPGRSQTQLADIAGQLQAGDVVELDPGTYSPVRFTRSGAADAPITIRGVGSPRPVIRGTSSDGYRATVHFENVHHYLMENVEVDGGGGTRETSTHQVCVRMMGNVLVLRNVWVHGCPRHGVLGTDEYSGTTVLDRVEISQAGAPAGSGENTKHAVYLATDRDRYPGSTARVMHSFIHDYEGSGVKSRAERNEIYYNWIDSALRRARRSGETQDSSLYSLEMYGYEVYSTSPRIDSEIVGNVLVHRDTYGLRLGGDGTGASRGRVTLMNNTVVVSSSFATSPVFRLFHSLESVYLLNNLFVRQDGSSQAGIRLMRDDISDSSGDGYGWVQGVPLVAGRNNWLPSGSDLRLSASGAATPVVELTGTLYGSANPGLASLASFDGLDTRLVSGSVLYGAGAAVGTSVPAAYQVPYLQTTLGYLSPPMRPSAGAALTLRTREAGSTSIGAQ